VRQCDMFALGGAIALSCHSASDGTACQRLRGCHMKLPLLAIAATLGMIAGADRSVAADQAPTPASQKTLSGEPADPPKRAADVTVTGTRAQLRPEISAFVNNVTDFDPADPILGLARWQVPFCPSVTGLARNLGEFILERVLEVARNAGVRLAGDNCRPNLYVLVNTQPQALLRAMERRNRGFTFGDASPPLINAFIEDPRPVKVWYFTAERTPEGQPLIGVSIPELNRAALEQAGVQVVTPGGVDRSFGTNTWSQSSHIRLNAVGAIYRVFVVVDQTRLSGANIGQIADYVAMVGLSQIKPGAALRDAPTILTLFSGGPQAARAGLSEWDREFLKSLYATDQKTVMQRSHIALEMTRAIASR
jgi:hypothetical protein